MTNQATAFTLFLFILATAASGRAEQPAALWLDHAATGASSEALMLDTEVFIEVTGMLAYSTVEQRFVNATGEWAEGRYVFPLPDDSAVESLIIRVGGRLIEGEIQERGQARQTYDQARREGRVAGLVEQDSASLFTTSVANIPPGEEVVIQVGFRQVVSFEHGRFSLRFPTTVAPRFAPADTPSEPGPGGLTAEPNPLKLTVDLRPGMELAALESSFHAIDSDYDGERWQVRMAGDLEGSRKDFELVWLPAARDGVSSTVFRQRLAGQDHALVLLVPPVRFDSTQTAREVILIIDTSGSMQGDAIVQARDSLLFALDHLSAGDRFNVIEFNSRTRSLFPQPVAASNRHVNHARDFVGRLAADGGTVMAPALKQAMAPGQADGHLRQIVFVTDGNIANEDDLILAIRRDIGSSRLFTVGIGHGVNSQFLGDAARHGRGSYTFIGERHQIHQRMSELTRQLTRPVLHDIELHWTDAVDRYPERIPDLYTGQPLMLSVRSDRLSGEVLVVGMSDGRPWQQAIPLETFQSASGVAAHWGRAAIQAELDRRYQGASADEVRARVLDLALEYQLLSPFTSLVAVDRTPSRSRQMALRRHAVPSNLPHGYRGEVAAGSLRALPATDGGSGTAVLRGLLALLLVALLLGHKRLSRDPDARDRS